MRDRTNQPNSQQGFTLVELAVSMMIIGLLLGGILKGQELIENARITSTIQQVKNFKTALASFRAKYNETPGDMISPNLRVPDCATAPCATGGNGDRYVAPSSWGVDTNVSLAFLITFTETRNFWLHMQKAGFMNGVDPNGATGSAPYTGREFPASPLKGSGFFAASAPSSSGPVPHVLRKGNIITLYGNASAPVIKATQAAAIDAKMDDGKPYTGDVYSASSCALTSLVTSDYKPTSDSSSLCEVVFYMSY